MKNIIMSLGGSMVVPDKIDLKFIKEFKKLILDFTNQGHKAAIICGGGKTCRIYQDAARELGCKDNDDLDWIGIRSTNLNAELVRSVFGEDAYEKVIDNPRDPIKSNKQIIIGSVNSHKLKDPEFYVMKLIEEFTELFVKKYNEKYINDPYDYLELLAKKNNMLKKGGEPDIDRMARLIIQSWQTGKFH